MESSFHMDHTRKAYVTSFPNLVNESQSMQNHVISERVIYVLLFCKEHRSVLMDIFVRNLKRKHDKDLRIYFATEIRHCLQTFMLIL